MRVGGLRKLGMEYISRRWCGKPSKTWVHYKSLEAGVGDLSHLMFLKVNIRSLRRHDLFYTSKFKCKRPNKTLVPVHFWYLAE